MADEAEHRKFKIGSETAANCWLCDRGRGELCHVHAPDDPNDREPPPAVIALPKGND